MFEFNPDNRWTIKRIKESDYYNGELATKEEVNEEF